MRHTARDSVVRQKLKPFDWRRTTQIRQNLCRMTPNRPLGLRLY
jgi:hypothetical protein